MHSCGSMKGRIVKCDITDYTTDGESITAAELGFGSLIAVVPFSMENGYMAVWNETTAKLLIMTAAAAQVALHVDVGVVGLMCWGV